MLSSVITNNSIWEILTNNYLLLKIKVWWKMKNFDVFEVHGKIQVLGEGGSRKTSI